MSYTAMAHGFTQHPKVMGLHDRAFRFHMAAIDYCGMNLTDGHVSARGVKVVAAVVDTRPTRWTGELVAAGLWKHDANGDGFWIHDYLKHNPSAEQAKALRDARRAAGLAGAAKRWASHDNTQGKSDDASHSKSHGTEQMPDKKREEKEKPRGFSLLDSPAAAGEQPPDQDNVRHLIEQSLREES